MRKILLLAAGLFAAGCAQHPAPTAQVAKSIAAVRGAREAGAREVPLAALHVKLAEEQTVLAGRLMEDEQNQRAEDKALRAIQDAELAIVLARQSAAQKQLEDFRADRGAGGEAALPSESAVAP